MTDLTYSSRNEYNKKYQVCKLYSDYGWMPEENKSTHSEQTKDANWIKVNFYQEVYIDAVVIQGGSLPEQGHCQRFKLQYWLKNNDAGKKDKKYVDEGKEFVNPSNKHGPKTSEGEDPNYNLIEFTKPIRCRYLKFLPTFWENKLFVKLGVRKYMGEIHDEDDDHEDASIEIN